MWGVLPGATDETIYCSPIATDGSRARATTPPAWQRWLAWLVFREGSSRSASLHDGVSCSAGHHNSTETTGHATARSNVSGTWLVDNRVGLFAKTALFINAEHLDLSTFVQLGANRVRRINAYTGMLWHAGGIARPKLQDIAAQAFRDFGVSTPPNLNRQRRTVRRTVCGRMCPSFS